MFKIAVITSHVNFLWWKSHCMNERSDFCVPESPETSGVAPVELRALPGTMKLQELISDVLGVVPLPLWGELGGAPASFNQWWSASLQVTAETLPSVNCGLLQPGSPSVSLVIQLTISSWDGNMEGFLSIPCALTCQGEEMWPRCGTCSGSKKTT